MKAKEFKGFGEIIKKYRTSNDYSQAELAKLVDVSRNTVINWENEKCQPDMASVLTYLYLALLPLTRKWQ